MTLIFGVDFTSAPSKRKPITCALGRFERSRCLHIDRVERIETFRDYEKLLARPGPWLGGFDHPFGQSVALLDALALPHRWADYVPAIARWERDGFAERIGALQAEQPAGAKEWHRIGDGLAKASAPHKLVHPPVGKMFFEGATRLLACGASVPPLHDGDPARIAVEAYPALIARRFAGSYKAEERGRQTGDRANARRVIVAGLRSRRLADEFGFIVRAPKALVDEAIRDASGDTLDAMLCAVHAGWSWSLRRNRRAPYGIPNARHPTVGAEGWIVDPKLLGAAGAPPA